MKGIKGCFVCHEDHRDNQDHDRDEATKSINKLKPRHPKGVLFREGRSCISELFDAHSDPAGSDVDIIHDSGVD